jgi:hypothetical protein
MLRFRYVFKCPVRLSPLTIPVEQVPRWYTSAVVMSNGSILVVGGTNTNSGDAQPNLEILPRTPGGPTVIYLDFLAQTYPYNLYPFLMVLPSGNILVSKSGFGICAFLLSD